MADGNIYRSTIQSPSRKTQCDRILSTLLAARGAWVPLPVIMACAAQYNARIFSLRRDGYNIENRTETIDGVRHSWFRLLASPAAPAPKPEPPKPRSWEEVCAEREEKMRQPAPSFELTP